MTGQQATAAQRLAGHPHHGIPAPNLWFASPARHRSRHARIVCSGPSLGKLFTFRWQFLITCTRHPWIVQVIPMAGEGSRRPSVKATHRSFHRDCASTVGRVRGSLSLTCAAIHASMTASEVVPGKRLRRRCPPTITSARHCFRWRSHLRVPSTSTTLASTAPWGRDRTENCGD
jgi:hypothetical protein